MDKKKYFETYAPPSNILAKLKKKLQTSQLDIFGSTGALGLSLLELLRFYDIKPKLINFYIRKNSDFSLWSSYLINSKIKHKIFYFKPDSLDVEINAINNNSTVLFFLGYAQPKKFLQDPQSLFLMNQLLLKITLKKPANIFYSSSSEIYSGILGIASETSVPITTPSHPRSAYIESKRSAEAILNNLRGGLRYVSFRIALASPPFYEATDNRILADICSMAFKKKSIKLSGGWDSIRQYQWGPICVIKILCAGYFGKSYLYNISGGQSIKLESLAKLIAKYLKVQYLSTSHISFDELGAPKNVKISSSLLETELGIKFKKEKISDLIKIYISNVFTR
jgi:hypothetical protein